MAVNILDWGSTKYVFASKGKVVLRCIHTKQQQKQVHFEKKFHTYFVVKSVWAKKRNICIIFKWFRLHACFRLVWMDF